MVNTAEKMKLIIIIVLILTFNNLTNLSLGNGIKNDILNLKHIRSPYKRIVSIMQTSTPEYLGKFIRSKDYITLNGTLVDETGNPLSGARIDLYLDDGDGILKKTEDLFLATNTTDDNGKFYFRILAGPEFREGNNTLIAHFDGGSINGQYYGPADEFYIVTIFVQAKVGISFSSERLALFEKNVSCDIWIYSDNGTTLSIANLTVNMSVYFSNETHSFKLFERELVTDSNGHNYTTISFNYTGNYTVYLLFNVTTNRELLGNFTVSEQQYFENDTLKGNDTSFTSGRFEVYKAVKILLWFNDDTNLKRIYAYKNGTHIRISGLFYNISGELDSQRVVLQMYDVKTDTTYYYYVNATDGAFSKELVISPENFTVGEYLLYATDTDPSTVDLTDKLYLIVKSKLRISLENTDEFVTKSFPASSIIGIEGKVIDIFSLDGVPNMTVKASFEGISNESIVENTTKAAGVFFLRIPIPDPVPSDVLTIRISASDSPLYDPDQTLLTIKTFNLILINITINESFYSWAISHGSIQMLTESDEYISEENQTLGVKVEVYDDFGNPHNAEIKIIAGNNTIHSETGSIVSRAIKVNSSSFYLRFQIFVADVNAELEVAILIKVRPKPSISPTSIVIPVIILAVIGVVISISLLAERKESEATITLAKGKVESVKTILNEIEDYLNIEKYISAIAKGGRLLLQIAKELKGSYPIWMTLREIVNYILEDFPPSIKEIVKNALINLVMVYEKVVYGHKKPSRGDIERFQESINIIKTYILPRIEGVSHGKSITH